MLPATTYKRWGRNQPFNAKIDPGIDVSPSSSFHELLSHQIFLLILGGGVRSKNLREFRRMGDLKVPNPYLRNFSEEEFARPNINAGVAPSSPPVYERTGAFMARKTPAGYVEAFKRILSAWERLRPDMTFGGMTLEQFKAAVQPGFDKRAAIEDTRYQAAESRFGDARRRSAVVEAQSAGGALESCHPRRRRKTGCSMPRWATSSWSVRHGKGKSGRKAKGVPRDVRRA